MTILYFAYGSNMLTLRMKDRIDSAQVYGVGRLNGWRIVCNKRSNDGSSKANIIMQENSTVWGVLYQIEEADLERLDKIEGGYQRVPVSIVDHHDVTVPAETYISEDLADHPFAKTEYIDFIIAGAKEHHLPADYVALLKQLPAAC